MFPYRKILAFLARLGNMILDRVNEFEWTDTQKKRQEARNAIKAKYQKRREDDRRVRPVSDRRLEPRRDDDRVRRTAAKIKT